MDVRYKVFGCGRLALLFNHNKKSVKSVVLVVLNRFGAIKVRFHGRSGFGTLNKTVRPKSVFNFQDIPSLPSFA